MIKELRESDVLEMFGKGFDCSQVVLSYFADKVGLSNSDALKISSAFGGGMWKGETCGAVVGGLMAIGMKFGQDEQNDLTRKNDMLSKKSQFENDFCKLQKSCVCREILGYDLSVKEDLEQIQEQNLLATKCPKVVLDVISCLEKII